MKSSFEDADDLDVTELTQPYDVTGDIRASPELPLPQCVADHRHAGNETAGRSPGIIWRSGDRYEIVCRQKTARGGLHRKHVEERRRYRRAVQLLGAGVGQDDGSDEAECGQSIERPTAPLPFQHGGRRDTRRLAVGRRAYPVQVHESIAHRQRQLAEKHIVDHAEDRRI